MSVDFSKVLFDLLPPGEAYSLEDIKLMKILAACSIEFSQYFKWACDIGNSIPDRDDIVLAEQWTKILGTKNLPAKLAERGTYVFDQLVTATKAHFIKLAEQRNLKVSIEDKGPFFVIISGLIWHGRGHPLNPPEVEDLANTLLRVKPAHLWIEFKNA